MFWLLSNNISRASLNRAPKHILPMPFPVASKALRGGFGLHTLLFACACLFANIAQAGALPRDEQERAEMRVFLKDAITKSDSFVDRFDAEVWLLDMSTRMAKYIPDPEERLELLRTIHREAKRAQLKPDLVLALIQVESRFDRFAVSRVGAQGLMQVMPFWKKELGHPEDNLTENNTNLRYGCQILRYYMQKESGNWRTALARYNGSYGKDWYPARVMDVWRERWYAGDM